MGELVTIRVEDLFVSFCFVSFRAIGRDVEWVRVEGCVYYFGFWFFGVGLFYRFEGRVYL